MDQIDELEKEISEANGEIIRLRFLLKDIKEIAIENVRACVNGDSQVAEEWCYELAELEY